MTKFIEHPDVTIDDRFVEPATGVWRRGQCDICSRYVVWRDAEVIHPRATSAPVPHALMPPDVHELYVEAAQVLPLSARAGAALLRAALERLIRHLDADDAMARDRLDERIARLKQRVSEPLGQLLDVVRYLGNEALHGTADSGELVYIYLNEDTSEIADLLFDAINDLVDELIARPSTVAGVWSRLPEGVRRSIELKRARVAEQESQGSAD